MYWMRKWTGIWSLKSSEGAHTGTCHSVRCAKGKLSCSYIWTAAVCKNNSRLFIISEECDKSNHSSVHIDLFHRVSMHTHSLGTESIIPFTCQFFTESKSWQSRSTRYDGSITLCPPRICYSPSQSPHTDNAPLLVHWLSASKYCTHYSSWTSFAHNIHNILAW